MSKKYAICIDEGDYPVSLERRKLYEVIKDADASKLGLIRVVDESGEDYLFSQDQFILVDLPEATCEIL